MSASSGKYLFFSIQGVSYALDLAQIAEVADPPQLSPIPLAPQGILGALNFHGDIVAVVDLATILGFSGQGSYQKIIILHKDVASLAFLIDSVQRIESENDLTREAMDSPHSCVQLCSATLRVALLDPTSLSRYMEQAIAAGDKKINIR